MCQSCQAVRINGRLCHEQGCPDAWKDYKVECKWCGKKFIPKDKYQICCSKSCFQSYMG
jgi:hypothetical protein